MIGTAYTHRNALLSAVAAQAAYSDSEAYIMRWVSQYDSGYVSVKYLTAGNVQAVVLGHLRFVQVAFRGTDEVRDWIDNINALTIPTPLGGQHRGFVSALDKIYHAVSQEVGAVRHEAAEPLPLYLTGHSLGGALATLYAARMMEEDYPFYSLYTFGSPRVGDREFARTFNVEAKDRTFRFCNNNDIVTRAPSRLMGYSHVGSLRYITERGAIEHDPGFWFRFLDGVHGAIADLGQIGLDGVKDHDMAHYINALEFGGT